MYALLWWARGFLVFLIGRRLAPGHDLFWYVTGALALVHSSDLATGWAGAGLSNQPGYTLWLPLSLYMLIIAFQQANRLRADIALVLAIFFEHLSLWSYESQILIILVAPILLFVLYRSPRRRPPAIAAFWYALPLIYLIATIRKYASSGGMTYQQSILRRVWSIGSILSDWLFNISASLRFWAWAGSQASKASTSQLVLPAVLAVATFLGGMILLVWFNGVQREKDSGWIPSKRTLWRVMLVGLLLLVLSFPAYLILESARSLWRTQILSGFGAALVLAAAISLCASYAPRRGIQLSAIALLSALVVGYGSFSAVKKEAFHRWVWDRQRPVMEQVLHIAPRLKPGTLVILDNVPKDNDPFLGDNEWFDMALRLAYPETPVGGVYFHQDGSPAAGGNLTISGDGEWKLRDNLVLPKGGIDAMLVLECDQHGTLSIARSLPGFLAIPENAARFYNPSARIENGNPSPRAVRRYAASGVWMPAPR